MNEQGNQKLTNLDEQFRTVKSDLARMDEKFNNIDKQFAQSNERLNRIEERINLVARNMNEIATSTRNQTEFFTEFLGFKKILEPRDVAFIKNELLRLSAKTFTNPPERRKPKE